MAARLRTGDTVVVITGKDKKKTGKVAAVVGERVLVEGINLVKRHMRPTPKNPQGGILEKEAPIHASNVMLVDPKTGKPTRVKSGTDDKGKKIRLAVGSGETIPFASTAKTAE